jgi:POT family proton-dependent oligopeptide transporter
MQGGWLAATALGNQLLFIGAIFYGRLEIWQLWSFFVICCLLSAGFIFFMMKRLERTTK